MQTIWNEERKKEVWKCRERERQQEVKHNQDYITTTVVLIRFILFRSMCGDYVSLIYLYFFLSFMLFYKSTTAQCLI